MATTADRFSRLAALKPARFTPAQLPEQREPCEEDTLARLLGAGVVRNKFGEHLVVRNWYSNPEFAHPSPATLEILSRTKDEALSCKAREALSDPDRPIVLGFDEADYLQVAVAETQRARQRK